jgi:asparagine synthase (glutamine-hydrolysing)
MCGIWACILNSTKDKLGLDTKLKLYNSFSKLKHRGPDSSAFKMYDEVCFLGFHRLSINGMSKYADQPMNINIYSHLHMICNGEIYNHVDLAKRFGISCTTGSDCEIILHLFYKFGIERTCELLDGVFAFTIYDDILQTLFIGRDPIGVRPLFVGMTKDMTIFSSEGKGLNDIVENYDQFFPGHYGIKERDKELQQYAFYKQFKSGSCIDKEEIMMEKTMDLLKKAVEKRLMSDRQIGCLLSGGFDSSLITALVAAHFPPMTVRTFAIGLEDSEDLKYAKIAATSLKTVHTEIVVTEQEMLDAIEPTIKQIESYDTTTVRASVPMYLLSLWIKNNTDITVILSGEGSDEISGSYLYFHDAPSEVDFLQETERLTRMLCYFDVLRSDRSTAGAGLEIRVPFLDLSFLDYYMSLPGQIKLPRRIKSSTFYKAYDRKIEKYFIRKTFDGFLPNEIQWRQKEGFSDGCSGKARSWYEIIQTHVDKLITAENIKFQPKHNPSSLKETFWYRKIFENCGYSPETIPFLWIPKWQGDISDPSARKLAVYDK